MGTRILKPSELTEEVRFRLKVTKWDYYQSFLKGEEADAAGRLYIKISVMRPTDTINKSDIRTRGLFWEIMRASGAGRRPGWIVMGENEPIAMPDIRWILRTEENLKTELMYHMQENRVQLWLYDDEEELSNHEKSQEITRNHEKSQKITPDSRNREENSIEKKSKEEEKEIRGAVLDDDVDGCQKMLADWIITERRKPYLTNLDENEISRILETYTKDEIEYAVNAAHSANAFKWNYLKKVLTNQRKEKAEIEKREKPRKYDYTRDDGYVYEPPKPRTKEEALITLIGIQKGFEAKAALKFTPEENKTLQSDPEKAIQRLKMAEGYLDSDFGRCQRMKGKPKEWVLEGFKNEKKA